MSLFILLYLYNKKELFNYPQGKPEPVSIIIPCYNESDSIGATLDSVLNFNYPKEMIEIIVVDDRSTDNSIEVIRNYMKKDPRIKLIINNRNSGGAAEPTNLGIKSAKSKYIALVDSDSTPHPDGLLKMIGFLQQDLKVGAVTCSILPKSTKTFIQKMQDIEYMVVSFTRKLLDLVDAVYVTPGPFALYRKEALLKVGLFDTKNMTQDIEIVWRLLSHGYTARMCLATYVRSGTPDKIKSWWKQRIRWNIGGTQTLFKYKHLFLKKGMLGAFVVPFFSLSLLLGVIGLTLFTYLSLRGIFISYLSTKYSLAAQTAIIRFDELSFSPSILNFFGIALFFLGIWFTIFCLNSLSEQKLQKHNIFNLLFYNIVYLTVYPILLLVALYKLWRGNYSW